jgi:hypothetical protein
VLLREVGVGMLNIQSGGSRSFICNEVMAMTSATEGEMSVLLVFW